MSIDKHLQCRGTYQDYQLWHAKRICSALSKEKKAELLEQIQSRIVLNGEKPADQKIYQVVMERLKEETK